MANPALVEMLGYADFAALSYRNLDSGVFDPSYPRKQFIQNIENSGVIQGYEYKWKRKDGTSIHVRENARVIRDAGGNALYFDGTIENITERKQAEEKVLASLAEKETLLKEVHHRVKNNMQVISSLLRLQERKVKDKDSAALLKDSQNRIQSMALVYNKLYRSENLAGIDMTEYINELAQGLVKSYAVSPSRITVQVAPGGVFLEVDLAIPCGMVVNELVTNSLKYAFPDNREGQIFISLKENPDHFLELIVSDDGVGIPENFNPDNTATLGIKLVSNLVRDQLGGKMELTRSPGTTFRITFRRAKEEK